MKQMLPIVFAAAVTATPLHAGQHDAPKTPQTADDELSQLGEFAESWMKRFADQMSPMVEQLKEMVDDLNAYEPPELLPNGDIIIRRKPKADTAEDDSQSIEL